MNQGRAHHAVGVVTDEATQEQLIIVTGGTLIMNHEYVNLNSTEILLAGNWSLGKSLLMPHVIRKLYFIIII